ARTIAVEHLHVAGVGRGAIEGLGRPEDSPHLLGTESILEVGEGGAFELEAVINRNRAMRRRHEQVPQPFRRRLALKLFDNRKDLPTITLALLRLIVTDARPDLGVHECANLIAPLGLGRVQAEIHVTWPIRPSQPWL